MKTVTASHQSIPRKIGLCVVLVVLMGLLGPFLVIGETWGMVWFYAAAPVSNLLEENIGLGTDSYVWIGFGSFVVAAFWGAVAYALSKLVTR